MLQCCRENKVATERVSRKRVHFCVADLWPDTPQSSGKISDVLVCQHVRLKYGLLKPSC